jgi:hypothetical protein
VARQGPNPGLGFELTENSLTRFPFAGTRPMARVFHEEGCRVVSLCFEFQAAVRTDRKATILAVYAQPRKRGPLQ